MSSPNAVNQPQSPTSDQSSDPMDYGSPLSSAADHQSVSSSAPTDASSTSSLQRATNAIDRVTVKLANLAERLADDDVTQEQRHAIHQESQQLSKDLEALKSMYKKMNKKDKVSNHSTRPVVPQDLPTMQWTGNVHDKNKLVFGSVEQCLNRFEDVVGSYNQDMDEAWGRLLPRMLSPEQRSWYDDNLRPYVHLPWSFARKTLIKKYGIHDGERQSQAMFDLLHMAMGTNESVEYYTDRFNKTRREAGLDDNLAIAAVYTKSLVPELYKHVRLAQVNLPVELRSTTEQAANVARGLYATVIGATNKLQVTQKAKMDNGNHDKYKKQPGIKKRCRLHGKGNHSTDECRLLSREVSHAQGNKIKKPNPSSFKSQQDKRCYKCNESWQPGHICKTKMAIRSAHFAGNQDTCTSASATTVEHTLIDLLDDINNDVDMEDAQHPCAQSQRFTRWHHY
ncbi:hypothetical protein O0I10_012949 [Lichtheimia ornata]|uniref:Retrotransposon gag domain-containing protein n=1 Tax=Lichtheimia ornata TaxID=688661 RepID=A0AAD7US97_9FUNG|nr:uncharacterized protein O0I10_012949 [Lichtheimia ornata]KAJ8651495.1 hypothetical protein O0I10_012949 [Lichtheimia ornata]